MVENNISWAIIMKQQSLDVLKELENRFIKRRTNKQKGELRK